MEFDLLQISFTIQISVFFLWLLRVAPVGVFKRV